MWIKPQKLKMWFIRKTWSALTLANLYSNKLGKWFEHLLLSMFSKWWNKGPESLKEIAQI